MHSCDKEKNAVTLSHSTQRKQAFWGEIKQISKSKKISPRKKVALKLLHYRLGYKYTISLMAGDIANFWKDIELRVYPNPFCISCQISSMSKKARSKNPVKPKASFKKVSVDIITATAPTIFTSETSFSCYLLTVDTSSKIPKLYVINSITTKQVMDKFYMFQSRFGKKE